MGLIPESRCFFHACSIRTGALIVCVVELLFLVAHLVFSFVAYFTHYISLTHLLAALLGCLVVTVVLPASIYGIAKFRAAWLIPCLALHIIGILLSIALVLLYIAALASYDLAKLLVTGQQQAVDRSRLTTSVVVTLVILVVWTCLLAWFFLILLGCYRYVHNREAVGKYDNETYPDYNSYLPSSHEANKTLDRYEDTSTIQIDTIDSRNRSDHFEALNANSTPMVQQQRSNLSANPQPPLMLVVSNNTVSEQRSADAFKSQPHSIQVVPGTAASQVMEQPSPGSQSSADSRKYYDNFSPQTPVFYVPQRFIATTGSVGSVRHM